MFLYFFFVYPSPSIFLISLMLGFFPSGSTYSTSAICPFRVSTRLSFICYLITLSLFLFFLSLKLSIRALEKKKKNREKNPRGYLFLFRDALFLLYWEKIIIITISSLLRVVSENPFFFLRVRECTWSTNRHIQSITLQIRTKEIVSDFFLFCFFGRCCFLLFPP